MDQDMPMAVENESLGTDHQNNMNAQCYLFERRFEIVVRHISLFNLHYST